MKLKLLFFFLLLTSFVLAQEGGKKKSTDEKRINVIISKMTLQEKAEMIGGYQGFNIKPLKRLGIPMVRMADGPGGVRNYGPSTAYPATLCTTASWDIDLMKKVGIEIGKEAKWKDIQIMLSPAMNIYRAPQCGRNFEYLGEDPFLAGKMAVAYIRGVQSEGVMATAKHYAANNQEWDRHKINSEVDERTLNEIYFPAFKASVQEGKVASIMNSYNLVNGVHASENDYLLNQVLKKEWGFEGFVMSDWGSTYNGINAANHGLDLEMPSGKFMRPDTIMAAVKRGAIKEEVINDKIRRMLRMYFKFGFMDSTKIHQKFPRDLEGADKVALDAARGGFVLLKNQNSILPLDLNKIKSIAVIGPNADPAVTGGGGSGYITPIKTISYYEAIKQMAGDKIKVRLSLGPVDTMPDKFYRNSVFEGKGLKGEYYKNTDLSGDAIVDYVKYVDFNFSKPLKPELGFENFSARWTGTIKINQGGHYKFAVSGDDGYRLYINDELVIDDWQDQGETLTSIEKELAAGKEYTVKLEYYQAGGDAAIHFGYGIVPEDASADLINAAKESDVAIVCIGFTQKTEGEGFDRTFSMPAAQIDLLKKVAEINKNTIVILNAGGNAGIAEWIDNIPALLHSWYPGQNGAIAAAEIISGKTNPSGKLPISLEKRWEDNPVYNSYYDPNKTGTVKYTEGIFVGYRGYEKNNVKPLFPFGFGLSYTSFKYSDIKLSKDVITSKDKLAITVTVKNTGKVEGKEVVELYIRDKVSSLPRPDKELKGFAKVSLKPGESKKVTITIGKDELSFFDPAKHKWVAEPGEFEALVGSSSDNILLTKKFTLK